MFSLDASVVRERARGHWRHILTALNVDPKYLSRLHGPCPYCGGKDRFRFDDKNGSGSFICSQCGSGDGFKLIQLAHGLNFPKALKLVANRLDGCSWESSPPPRTALEPEKFCDRKAARILQTWSESSQLKQTDPAWKYLVKKLAIPNEHAAFVDASTQLRSHPSLKYWHHVDDKLECMGRYPALVGAITSSDGALVNVQILYLTDNGDPASVPSFKKLMPSPLTGITKGGAVKLHEPGKSLGLAEGITTALAVRHATGFACWAAVSAYNLKSVCIPPSVEEVLIFADADESETGQREALAAARRYTSENLKVKIITPTQLGSDWADVVKKQNQGIETPLCHSTKSM